MAVAYNSASAYGWLIDLAALAVAVVGTATCGVSVLRASTLPPRVGRAMLVVFPLTPVAGFLTFWYLPPGLTMGLLLSWAVVTLQLSGWPRRLRPGRLVPRTSISSAPGQGPPSR